MFGEGGRKVSATKVTVTVTVTVTTTRSAREAVADLYRYSVDHPKVASWIESGDVNELRTGSIDHMADLAEALTAAERRGEERALNAVSAALATRMDPVDEARKALEGRDD